MPMVSGRVVLRGTDRGIPGVLVSIYLEITRTSPTGPGGGADADGQRWRRLVSTVTDHRGGFGAAYDTDRANGGGSDLVVVVSSPEENETRGPGDDGTTRLAMRVRRNAAAAESFVISVDEARLVAAGVAVPKDTEDVGAIVERRRAAVQRQRTLRAELGRLTADRLEARRQVERLAEPKFATFLSALSGVAEPHRNLDDARYVAPGTDIEAANRAVIQSGIRDRVNRASVGGAVPLSAAQASAFRDPHGQFRTDISAAEITPYLKVATNAGGPSQLRRVPPSVACHAGPIDPCVEILEGKAPTDEDLEEPEVLPCPGDDPLPSAPATIEDIPLFVGNLVNHTTPPESATIFKVHCRAGMQQVQKSVDGFSLKSGPADAAAIYDFHTLSVAFEHVWQELFDNGLVKAAKELYADLVEIGVDPNAYFVTDATNPKELAGFIAYLKSLKTDPSNADLPDADTLVTSAFDITPEQWAALTADQQARLIVLADAQHLTQEVSADFFNAENNAWLMYKREQLRSWRRQGERMIGYADGKVRASQGFEQFHKVLADLETAMRELYRFSIYAATGLNRSINFGVVATYRQEWKPVSYQVGRLVKTVPLAPKEVRRFTKKVAIRKSRSEKEVENNLQTRRSEASETTRAETEIVHKALRKTNFQASAEGGVNVAIASAKASTAFGQDAATESQEVKKEFREAVFKAAEEYKSERTTEVNVSTGEELSVEESGEISNPNDEIPVTYLFYELQRRFRVNARLHAIRPVILVAQEFPNPSDIDEDWIIRHDWILRRVILDDSFTPALNYVSSKVVGDEFALGELFKNVEQQRRLTEELKEELLQTRSLAEGRYAALQRSMQDRADALQSEEESGSITPMPVGFLMSDTDASPEAQQVREDAARDAFERASRQAKELETRLERESGALSALTESYTKQLSDHLNRKTQIARLRVHIKANIMYYMQAIWSFEPPDQRFFRLHQVRVPRLSGDVTYKLEEDPDALPMPPDWIKPTKIVASCTLDPDHIQYDALVDVADLDTLLGFKGNYMMFPLKTSNVLTDFMTIPYLDPVFGVRDPDPLASWSLDEFVEYVCCLRKTLTPGAFTARLPALMDAYRRILNAPGAEGDEIVVPTDSLFIETLPGVHPILEDFKLFHRVIDVKKAQAEVRAAEVENVRVAARILHGERGDPNIEKKIVVQGGEAIVVPPEDA